MCQNKMFFTHAKELNFTSSAFAAVEKIFLIPLKCTLNKKEGGEKGKNVVKERLFVDNCVYTRTSLRAEGGSTRLNPDHSHPREIYACVYKKLLDYFEPTISFRTTID